MRSSRVSSSSRSRAWSGRRRWRARPVRAFALASRRGLATNTARCHAPCGRAGRAARSSARVLAGDRARPLLGAWHELAGDADGRVERAAVEAGEERLGDVVPVRTTGGAAGTSMRRALSRQMASTMPVRAERVTARASTLGSRAATPPGMASATSARRSGSTSAGVQRTEYDACSPRDGRSASALAQQGHHRAARGQLHRPDRDLAQPADARADVVAHLAGAGGDEPAEHLADRRRDRGGLLAVGHGDVRVRGPGPGGRRRPRASRRPRRRRRRAPGPPAQATTRPGSHESWRRTTPGSKTFFSAVVAPPGVPCTLAPVAGDARIAAGVLAVRRNTRRSADGAGARRRRRPGRAPRPEAAGRDEVLLGVDEQAQQRRAPGRAVGFEDRELVGRGHAIGLGLDVQVEGRVVDALRRDPRSWSCC